jgi:6,7-dimethyl-8-ribityllumazine synthase
MKTEYQTINIPKIPDAKIVILQAKWYKETTDNLIRKCVEVLEATDCSDPEIHIIPGSLELPLAAQTILKKHPGKYEAIICVGAIMKGETLHFDMIVDECTRGLGQVMLQYDTPIILEVIPIMNIEQLQERCGDNDFNKGIEAALATAEMIAWRRKINEQ